MSSHPTHRVILPVSVFIINIGVTVVGNESRLEKSLLSSSLTIVCFPELFGHNNVATTASTIAIIIFSPRTSPIPFVCSSSMAGSSYDYFTYTCQYHLLRSSGIPVVVLFLPNASRCLLHPENDFLHSSSVVFIPHRLHPAGCWLLLLPSLATRQKRAWLLLTPVKTRLISAHVGAVRLGFSLPLSVCLSVSLTADSCMVACVHARTNACGGRLHSHLPMHSMASPHRTLPHADEL